MERGDRGNFDLIRLVAAGAVLLSHAFLLTSPAGAAGGRDPLEALDGARFSLGGLAVDVFFVLSGYLVAQSWLSDRRPGAYLARRALRLGPGLAVNVAVTVLLVGPLLSSLPPPAYFAAPGTRSFAANALLYHAQATLPGVFSGNVWRPDVNGSLWTLRYELTWYLAIPLLAAAGAGMARRLAPALLALTLTGLALLPLGAGRPLPFELDLALLLLLGAFGAAGMVLCVHRDAVPMRWWICVGLLALWVATWRTPLLNVTAVLAFGYTAIYLATRRSLLRLPGDVSYGVYLYGFVCEQVAVAALGAHASPLTVLLLATPLTVACALLSWRWVEAPALALKSRLRRRAVAASPAPA